MEMLRCQPSNRAPCLVLTRQCQNNGIYYRDHRLQHAYIYTRLHQQLQYEVRTTSSVYGLPLGTSTALAAATGPPGNCYESLSLSHLSTNHPCRLCRDFLDGQSSFADLVLALLRTFEIEDPTLGM